MSSFSDSDHCRLEAIVLPDNCIVESHQISDASRGLRRVPVTKVWRTERILGRGSFGEVHLQSQDDDKDAKRALKVIRTSGTEMSFTDRQRELTAMVEFTKPRYKDAAVFVDFIGWFQNDNAMYLAMEFMPLGDLEHNVREIENLTSQTESSLSEEDVQEITRQILEGLKIMHTQGFAHRDLKPQNIFVVQRQPQWWVKLGDFGLSKRLADGTVYRTHTGTQEYMAPELFYYVPDLDTNTSEYTNAVDLWSLGCIIYRLVTRAVPFPSLLSLKNYCKNPSEMPLKMPPSMDEARKFVQELLLPNPSKRPGASGALECSWLTSKNIPNIILNGMATNLATSEISTTEDGYNTSSHKGLQSKYNLLTMENAASGSSLHRPGLEPLLPPKIDPIVGPSSPALRLGPQRGNTPPLIKVEDGEYHVNDRRAPYDFIANERSKLSPLQGPGKTAPRLIQDLLDYDPRWLRQNGDNSLADSAVMYQADGTHSRPERFPQSCKHDLWRKESQTFLPATDKSTISKYVSASYCTRCLYHFHVIVDVTRKPGREIPCKLGTEYPLHHFQHRQTHYGTAHDSEMNKDKYYNFEEFHTFSCSAPSCPATIEIWIYRPRLNKELLLPILDPTKVTRRGQKAIKGDFERFSDYRSLKPQEVLMILRRYLYDTLTQSAGSQKRVNIRNKRFQLGFADECDALFEYLDFGLQFQNFAQHGDQDQFWLLPALEPLNDDRFAVQPKRKFIEDILYELSARITDRSAQHVLRVSTQVGITLEPATEDLYIILGCAAYTKCSNSITDIEGREQKNAYYEGLGAVNDFSDELLAFAFRRQRSCDPENSSYYFDCLRKI